MEYELATLDGVDTAIASHYKPTDDGKFRLEVNGLPAPEDTTGLKKALQTERQSARDAAAKLKAYTDQYETPEAIKEAMDAIRADAGNKDPKESNEFMLLQGQLEKAQSENAAFKSESEKSKSMAANVIRDAAIQAALVENKATETGMKLLKRELSGRVKVALNENGSTEIQVFDADGETPMIGSGKDGAATVADLVKADAIKSFPELFQSEGGSGSGKQPGAGGSGGNGKTLTRTAFNALSPAIQSQRMQEGYTLTDD